MRTLLFMALLALSGCANGFGKHSSRMNSVSLGMTKAQVIEQIGEPISVSAEKGVEYLHYRFFEVAFGPYMPYFVRIKEGRVDSYGRTGDFDTTRAPTTRIEVEQRTTN